MFPTMFRAIILLGTLVQIFLADSRQFRFDYKYEEDINGWIKYHPVPADWHEARLRCQLEGAVIASPINKHLLAAMKSKMSTEHIAACGVFTGIHATYSTGDYASEEGVPLSKISVTWAPLEPDNFENKENCLMLLVNGTMADVRCDEVFPYMCYKKKSKSMVVSECGTIDNEYQLSEVTGNCYKFHVDAKSWDRAYMTCAAEGAHLAVINSDAEAQVLKNIFAKYPENVLSSKWKDSVLLGFRDRGELGIWTTIHGEYLKEAGYGKWSGGQPDNALNNQHCGSMFRTGLLDDIWCIDHTSFICEKTPDSVPLSKISVTWAPLEPDNFENKENCLMLLVNGTMADVRCDEVFPYMCYKKKSKSMVVSECGTIDNEYQLSEVTGNCYKFHVDAKSWDRAYMTCAAEGAHLAVINSDAEAQVLKNIFAKYPENVLSSKWKDSVLLGFRDRGELGIWTTIHGEYLKEAGYGKWSGGQPDNALNNQHCGSMFRTGLLDDIWCIDHTSFICEKTPDSLLID